MSDLTPALDLLVRTRQALLDRAAAIAPADWGRSPAPGVWAPADLFEHLALVERNVERHVLGILFREPAAPELRAKVREDDRVHRFLSNRNRRVTAPDWVTPRRKWPEREAALQAFTGARDANLAGFRAAPPEPRSYAMAHPFLGVLDGVQWGLFLGWHVERHLAQLDEITAALA